MARPVDKEMAAAIGRSIRLMRRRKGETQAQTSRGIGLFDGSNAVAQYERGASVPSWPVMCRISDHFHVGLDELRHMFENEIKKAEDQYDRLDVGTPWELKSENYGVRIGVNNE
jgi:transcriptional regulator with XRE-family HTH domain